MRDRKFWKTLMEADTEADLPDGDAKEEEVSKTDSDETQIIEELVYPFELTRKMMQSYEDPVYNRDQLGNAYPEVIRKLLRSTMFWRMRAPVWLISRAHAFK